MPIEVNMFAQERNDDLARRVKNFLSSRHQPGFQHLHVEAQGGTVTVSGRVGSFHEKQLSYQCCSRVAGVVAIIDLVDVRSAKKEPSRPSDRPKIVPR